MHAGADWLSHPKSAVQRTGTIPEDWLVEPAEVGEVEEALASEWMSDYWLDLWRALVNRVEPGDELWYYVGRDCGPADESGDWQDGYALVRDGTIIDHLGRYPW